MPNPSQGDTVTVHLTFRLADSSVVRSTREGDPIDITLGAQQVMPEVRALVPWIERALLDMAQGENRTVTIAADDAYGPYNETLVQTVIRSVIQPDLDSRLEIGMMLQTKTPEGGDQHLKVVALTEESVTLDANHPLAGEDLTFDLELVKIA